MQPLFAFLDITLLLTSCVGKESAMDSGLSQLYSQLDVEIEVSVGYAATKEERIADLCGRLVRISDGESRTPIIDRLIGEYEAYDADSALYYIGLGLKHAKTDADERREMLLNIKRADILAHAELFSDALSVMERVSHNALDKEGKEKYYSTYCAIYQYLSEYTSEHEPAAENEGTRRLYVDSLSQVASPES